MATSKTARRSSPGAKQGFKREGRTQWVIPLAQGAYARICDPSSPRMLHLRTDSDEFVAAVRAVNDAGYGSELRAQLTELGWESQLAFLDAAGAFEADSSESEAA